MLERSHVQNDLTTIPSFPFSGILFMSLLLLVLLPYLTLYIP